MHWLRTTAAECKDGNEKLSCRNITFWVRTNRIAWLVYWLGNGFGQSGTRASAETRFIYFFQHAQSGSVAHLNFYSIGTGFLPVGTTAGAWSWPFTSIWCRDWNLFMLACISTQSLCLNGVDRQNVFVLHVAKPAEGRCCLALVNCVWPIWLCKTYLITDFISLLISVKLVRSSMNFQRHYFQECGNPWISIGLLQNNWTNTKQSVVYRYEHTVCCHNYAFQLVEFSYKSLRPLHHTLRLYRSECGNILKKLYFRKGCEECVYAREGKVSTVEDWCRVVYITFVRLTVFRLQVLKVRLFQRANFNTLYSKYINSSLLCADCIKGTDFKPAVQDLS